MVAPVIARDDKLYCTRLAQWMVENWFDRTDGIASWSDNKGRFFCDNNPGYTYDGIIEALVHSFMGRGPAKHKIIGSYYINPLTQKTRHVAIDIDAHKEDETAEEPRDKVEAILAAAQIEYVLARSKGAKGYHIRALFPKPVSAVAARNFGLELVNAAGYPLTEVNPKQWTLEIPWGNQVAIPGSRHFYEKKGGSVLLHPKTHEEIPFGEWLGYLSSVKRLEEKTLRAMGARVGKDLWAPPREVKPAVDLKVTVKGLPEISEIGHVEAVLRKHGIEGGTPQGVGGRWTDKILLKECPNAEAHGSKRGDGAAILFNKDTKRVGFKCHHAGCEASKFSWPKLLRKLGYKVVIDGPVRGQWIYKEEDCPLPKERAPDADAEGASRPARKKRAYRSVERVRESDKDRMLEFWQANDETPNKEFLRLVRRLRRVANCGRVSQLLECAVHSAQGMIRRPCDDVIFCTRCAEHAANVREEHAKLEWTEKVYMIEKLVPIGDRAAMQTAWKEMKAEVDHFRSPLPMFVEGAGRILFFWPERMGNFVKTCFKDAVELPRGEAARKMASAFYEVHHYFLTHYLKGSLINLLEFPWFKHFRKHRVGGGGESCRELPMTDVFRERKKKNAEWKKEHPGADRNKCCEIVGEKDGKPVYCCQDLMSTATYTPSGAVIGRKVGAFRDHELLKAMNSTGVEFEYLKSKGPAFSVG